MRPCPRQWVMVVDRPDSRLQASLRQVRLYSISGYALTNNLQVWAECLEFQCPVCLVCRRLSSCKVAEEDVSKLPTCPCVLSLTATAGPNMPPMPFPPPNMAGGPPGPGMPPNMPFPPPPHMQGGPGGMPFPGFPPGQAGSPPGGMPFPPPGGMPPGPPGRNFQPPPHNAPPGRF